MSARRFVPATAVLLLSVAIACTKILAGKPAGNVNVTPAVQRVFSATCTTSGCHNSTSNAGGLNLDEGAGDASIGKASSFSLNKIVDPGKPDQSELYTRLVTDNPTLIMPRNRARLSDRDIQTIRNWIANLSPVTASPTPAPTPTVGGLPPFSNQISFARDVMPIFTATCSTSGCHNAATRQNNLDLSTAAGAYLGLMGSNGAGADSFQFPPFKAVIPGDPANSMLFVKVASETPRINNQPVGARMPNVGAMLPRLSIETIRAWIQQGAKNN